MKSPVGAFNMEKVFVAPFSEFCVPRNIVDTSSESVTVQCGDNQRNVCVSRDGQASPSAQIFTVASLVEYLLRRHCSWSPVLAQTTAHSWVILRGSVTPVCSLHTSQHASISHMQRSSASKEHGQNEDCYNLIY